jgi:hypothetical protein
MKTEIFKKKLNFEILWNFWNLMKNFEILNFNFFFYITNVSQYYYLNIKILKFYENWNFIHWFCTRVQYGFLLHRNFFLLINMLENGMSGVLLLANRKTVK